MKNPFETSVPTIQELSDDELTSTQGGVFAPGPPDPTNNGWDSNYWGGHYGEFDGGWSAPFVGW